MSRVNLGTAALVVLALAVFPAATPSPAAAGTVLIYGPSMSAPTPFRPDNEQTLAQAAGHTVTVVSAAGWAGLTTAQFAQYDALVFGDPTCAVGTGLLAAAEANRAIWSAAVNGPVYVQGTDSQFHVMLAQAQQMITNGIDFVANSPGTGLYVSLSCYYAVAPDNTPVPLLDPFGTFLVGGQQGCPSQVTIVDPTHPAMAGLTNAGLSNWGCSPHDFLLAFPGAFGVLATGLRPSDQLHHPYIIATPPVLLVGIDIKPGSDPNGLNPRAKGVIPVAILTSATFDAWDVDPASIAFGPHGAAIAHATGHAEDVDGDGDLDMVVHFRTPETGIACGDTAATLTGQTFGGQAIEGTDSIKTTGCPKSLAAGSGQPRISERALRRALRKQARVEQRLARRALKALPRAGPNRPDR